MAKPTEAQIEIKQKKRDAIAEVIYELEAMHGKYRSGTAELSHSEVPDAVYNRIFAREAVLEAKLKTLARDL